MTLFGYPTRICVYAFVSFAVCQLVHLAVTTHGIQLVARENGPVEQVQVAMALFTAACLFYAAWHLRVGRVGLIVCGCLVGYAAARECDVWFESTFFNDAYKFLAGLPLAGVALIALFRGRKQVFVEASALLRTPAITILSIAGIYLCTVCQLFDRPALWTAIGDGPAAETTKAAMEEFAELFGYLFLTFAGVESVAMASADHAAESIDKQNAPTVGRQVT